MASYTNNYSLAKPDYTDEADIKIINNNTDTIDNLIHQNRSMISDSYDSTKTYSVGDVVIYEGTLYKCITDVVAAESFDKTKWEQTTAVANGSGGGSQVTITPTLGEGTKIAEFTIGTKAGVLYAPTQTSESGNSSSSDPFTQFSSAGFHNSIYRGKSLGSTITDEQWANIKNGTFTDMYIGDYWTLDGINHQIASFDYYYNFERETSDDYWECTDHHIVLVPDTELGEGKINQNKTTSGGYLGSYMYQTVLPPIRTRIKNIFGDHLMKRKDFLSDTVTNGKVESSEMVDIEVELMTEYMVFGHTVYSSDLQNSYDYSQFPLFLLNRGATRFKPLKATSDGGYWLRDVHNDSDWCMVRPYGMPFTGYSNDTNGIVPSYVIF